MTHYNDVTGAMFSTISYKNILILIIVKIFPDWSIAIFCSKGYTQSCGSSISPEVTRNVTKKKNCFETRRDRLNELWEDNSRCRKKWPRADLENWISNSLNRRIRYNLVRNSIIKKRITTENIFPCGFQKSFLGSLVCLTFKL